MSEKLYGAKCIRCGCIDHQGSEGLEADPIPWLEPRGLECARCTFCQERALSRAIQEAGLFIFAPEVREAVQMFKRGDTSHPITQSLRASCLAIEAEGESGTPEAILSEIEFSQAVNDVTHAHRHNDAVKSLVRHDSALRRQNNELAQAAETLAGAADALEVEHDEWIGWYEEMRLRAEAAEARVAVLTETVDVLRSAGEVAQAGWEAAEEELRIANERGDAWRQMVVEDGERLRDVRSALAYLLEACDEKARAEEGVLYDEYVQAGGSLGGTEHEG